MGSDERNKQYSQNQLYHLNLIPFIKSTAEANETVFDNKECVLQRTISGEEASEFYNSVISTPSTSKVESAAVCHKMVKKKVETASKTRKAAPTTQLCNPLKYSIFHYAQEGNLKGVETLISGGCSVNQQDMYGWTPLMCAAYEGHSCIVEYLMKCTADLNIKNNMNMTALDIALQTRHSTVISLLQNRVSKAADNRLVPKSDHTVKHCNACNISYYGPSVAHERSIIHLFSSEKINLSTYYHLPENNKGFQIMLKNGWDKNKGLGLNADGRKYPIKTVLKRSRACIGRTKDVPKVTHFGPNDSSSVSKHNKSGIKLVRERTLKRWEKNILEKKQRKKEINFRRQFYDT